VKRRLLVIPLALAGLLVTVTAASAEFHGTDIFGNVAPGGGVGGLADRYPASAYGLDYHVDVGVTNLDGVPSQIAQWMAAQLWGVTVFLLHTVIDLFGWAFSLDLLNGRHGALLPIAGAVQHLYTNVFGGSWLVAAIMAAGIWGIWKALGQRRYQEAFTGLAISMTCAILGLLLIFDPAGTIGLASRMSNDMKTAFLSATNTGDVNDPAGAKRQVSDHLWETLVYRPWVVLEFGGLKHCVDLDKKDEHGFPTPVAIDSPAKDICRDHIRRDATGHGGYAARFLDRPIGSDSRNKEYEVLRDGELPTPVNAQFANGYMVDKADSPAVDMMQQGGAYQRLTMAIVVFVGALGPVALLGFLTLAMVIAQVLALVIFAFAGVLAIVGWIPGVGHDAFRAWISRLGLVLFAGALYALALGIIVAISGALANAVDTLGWLYSWGLQSVFFWSVLLYRKKLLAAVSTERHHRLPPELQRHLSRGMQAAAHPIAAVRKSPAPQPTAPTPGPATPPPVPPYRTPSSPTPTPATEPLPPVKNPAMPRAFPPPEPVPERT
jgi:hypothetical protein